MEEIIIETNKMLEVLRVVLTMFQKAYQLSDREMTSIMMVVTTEIAERISTALIWPKKEAKDG